jgi:catechol 2,3-dioxygenase-like lactoylglutathione lyase family enzyme
MRWLAHTDAGNIGGMPPIARWKDLCIDATDAHRMARFWGGVLGLQVELHDDGDAALRGTAPEETVWVNAVPEPRTVKQRVHLDIETAALEPVLALGATLTLPATESGFGWDVLADPEGGELCAFVRGDGPTRLYEMGVDAADTESAARAARWWADLIGGTAVDDPRGFSWIEDVPGLPFDSIDFAPVPEPKSVKNRIHWDIASDDLEGIVARGATVIGQTPDWHVLADPDGNEFCVFPS